MYKERISAEVKIDFIERYHRGEGSIEALAKAAGVAPEFFRTWLRNYESCGAEAFSDRRWRRYSAELKESAVRDCLSSGESQGAVCKKYGIRSRCQLQVWIMSIIKLKLRTRKTSRMP